MGTHENVPLLKMHCKHANKSFIGLENSRDRSFKIKTKTAKFRCRAVSRQRPRSQGLHMWLMHYFIKYLLQWPFLSHHEHHHSAMFLKTVCIIISDFVQRRPTSVKSPTESLRPEKMPGSAYATVDHASSCRVLLTREM